VNIWLDPDCLIAGAKRYTGGSAYLEAYRDVIFEKNDAELALEDSLAFAWLTRAVRRNRPDVCCREADLRQSLQAVLDVALPDYVTEAEIKRLDLLARLDGRLQGESFAGLVFALWLGEEFLSCDRWQEQFDRLIQLADTGELQRQLQDAFWVKVYDDLLAAWRDAGVAGDYCRIARLVALNGSALLDLQIYALLGLYHNWQQYFPAGDWQAIAGLEPRVFYRLPVSTVAQEQVARLLPMIMRQQPVDQGTLYHSLVRRVSGRMEIELQVLVDLMCQDKDLQTYEYLDWLKLKFAGLADRLSEITAPLNALVLVKPPAWPRLEADYDELSDWYIRQFLPYAEALKAATGASPREILSEFLQEREFSQKSVSWFDALDPNILVIACTDLSFADALRVARAAGVAIPSVKVMAVAAVAMDGMLRTLMDDDVAALPVVPDKEALAAYLETGMTLTAFTVVRQGAPDGYGIGLASQLSFLAQEFGSQLGAALKTGAVSGDVLVCARPGDGDGPWPELLPALYLKRPANQAGELLVTLKRREYKLKRKEILLIEITNPENSPAELIALQVVNKNFKAEPFVLENIAPFTSVALATDVRILPAVDKGDNERLTVCLSWKINGVIVDKQWVFPIDLTSMVERAGLSDELF